MSEFQFRSISGQTEWGRGRIYDNAAELIGNTPIVRINKTAAAHGAKGDVLMKLDGSTPPTV